MNTKPLVLGVIAGILITWGVGATEGCKPITPGAQSALEQTGATILCVLEEDEITDPTLDKMCQNITGQLTPEQKTAILAHAQRNGNALKKTACESDGGAK